MTYDTLCAFELEGHILNDNQLKVFHILVVLFLSMLFLLPIPPRYHNHAGLLPPHGHGQFVGRADKECYPSGE